MNEHQQTAGIEPVACSKVSETVRRLEVASPFWSLPLKFRAYGGVLH
jgi:hypothetical protein